MAVPHRREIEAEERLLNEPLYQDLRPRVVELIDRIQRAEAPEDWVYLHRDLLIEFGARQDATDETLPAAKMKVANEMRELAGRTPKPIAELSEKQVILDRIRRQERVAIASQHTLRQIGDAIAWRALQYDRRAISILGDGERVGRLASGVGRDAELAELARLWEDEGVFALHNDLTNCLRHGDLTVIRPTEEILEVTLIEVKAGARPEESPQLERLARATDLLREGRRISDHGSLQLTVIPAPYNTYLDLLPELLMSAREHGFSWARPHDCLVVGAVDYRVWGREAARYSTRCDAARRAIAWGADEPDTLGWTASLRRMRDRSWSFSSLAPFTIFPLSPEDVADVVMGFVDIAIGLHLGKLEQALADGGHLEVTLARPPETGGLFLEASRGRVGLRVPPHLREQMMTELMTPGALYAALDHVLTLNEARPDEVLDSRLVVFADEREVWERQRA